MLFDMNKKLNFPILLGTAREGRQSEKVAKFLFQEVSKNLEIETQIADPKDFNFGEEVNFDATKDPKYSKITQEADGFIIVTPEYNHSFPSSLKKMLDSELKNYIHKPVIICGVSAGNWGGIRAIQSLIPVLREVGMVVTFADLQFPNVSKLFDENGEILDKKYESRVQKSLEELIWMGKTLKYGRENFKSKHH